MNTKRFLLALSFLTLLTSSAFAQSAGGHVLVLDFKDNVTQEQINDFEARYGVHTHLNSIYSAPYQLRVSDPISQEQEDQVLPYMQTDPLLEVAEESQTYSIPEGMSDYSPQDVETDSNASFPNDPKYKYQWHMNAIRMPEAWQMQGGTGKGAIVAVIDTGVAYENYENFKQVEDLKNTCFVPGYDFVNDDTHPNDDNAHGTHVAGTIAQSTNNGIGVAGIAYEACIMPLKVLSATGSGTTADIADAIRFAADHKANVINMSLGGPQKSKDMSQAIAYAISKGVVVVAAAGNDGSSRPGYPAADEGVIAVSATNSSNGISFYSTWGKAIDIAAPGGDTRTDANGDGVPDGVIQNTINPRNIQESGYYPFQGTSMAAPHVAGAVADIFAAGIKDSKKVEQILYASANRKIAEEHGAPKGVKWDDKYGNGFLDVAAALTLAKKSKEADHSLMTASSSTTINGILDEINEGMVFLALSLSVLLLLGMNHLLTSQNNLDDKQKFTSIVAGSLVASVVFGFLSGTDALDDSWLVSVLFLSAIIPVSLVALWNSTSFKASIAGVALTFAGVLLYASVETSGMVFNNLLLDKIWLLGNAATCLFFSYNSLKKN